MEKLRIIFMGTPEFAVATLKAVLDNGYNVVGVITAPDKQAGRGRKIKQSAVKEFAIENNLKVLQPLNLKNEEFINELKSLEANLQIVVAFRMLPEIVWAMPKYGTFNLHASLLPDYRGAAPINWAIINGESTTGVTTFFIDKKIDTGNIILQKEVNIEANELAGGLHDKLMDLGSALVVETIKKIEKGNIKTIVQTTKEDKEAPKLNKDNCKVDWKDKAIHIYNKIRGLSPYPLAWSTIVNNDDSIEVKIYDSTIEKIHHNFEIGQIITDKNSIKVVVKDGFILLNELKLAGKRKMDAKSLLNGFKFSENAKML